MPISSRSRDPARGAPAEDIPADRDSGATEPPGAAKVSGIAGGVTARSRGSAPASRPAKSLENPAKVACLPAETISAPADPMTQCADEGTSVRASDLASGSERMTQRVDERTSVGPNDPVTNSIGQSSGKRRGVRPKSMGDWGPAFIGALLEGKAVRVACATAGIDQMMPFNRRKTDPIFAQAWAEAGAIATELLEAEACRRAYHGTIKPVFHRGERVGAVREYSDALLTFMLKARRPDVYRDGHADTSGRTPINIQVIGMDGSAISLSGSAGMPVASPTTASTGRSPVEAIDGPTTTDQAGESILCEIDSSPVPGSGGSRGGEAPGIQATTAAPIPPHTPGGDTTTHGSRGITSSSRAMGGVGVGGIPPGLTLGGIEGVGVKAAPSYAEHFSESGSPAQPTPSYAGIKPESDSGVSAVPPSYADDVPVVGAAPPEISTETNGAGAAQPTESPQDPAGSGVATNLLPTLETVYLTQ